VLSDKVKGNLDMAVLDVSEDILTSGKFIAIAIMVIY
jgi:hypothetical protein